MSVVGQLEREHAYSWESARLLRDLDLVERLRAALEAAEELEARGIAWDEAWRDNEDWQRLARIALLLSDVHFATRHAMNPERVQAWDERLQRRMAMQTISRTAAP